MQKPLSVCYSLPYLPVGMLPCGRHASSAFLCCLELRSLSLETTDIPRGRSRCWGTFDGKSSLRRSEHFAALLIRLALGSVCVLLQLVNSFHSMQISIAT